jgi:hypothetical protein
MSGAVGGLTLALHTSSGRGERRIHDHHGRHRGARQDVVELLGVLAGHGGVGKEVHQQRAPSLGVLAQTAEYVLLRIFGDMES